MAAVAAIALTGCRKPSSANWDVDVVLPLVNSKLNISNFAGDSIFSADNTGLLHFSVTRQVTSIKLDSLLQFPDTVIKKDFPIPLIAKLPPGYAINIFPASELTFNIDKGVQLKKAIVRRGSLKVKFVNDLAEALDLLYIIPSAVRNGTPLTIFETIPPLPDVLEKSYDISGYTLDLTGMAGNKVNTIVQTNTVYVNPNADSVFINFGQGPKLEIAYEDLTPEYVEGYFGQQTIDIALDTARLDLVDNFRAGNFMLSEATLNFKVINGFGAEFSGGFSNIKAINSSGNSIIPLNTNQLGNININRATKAGTTVFPSIKTLSLSSANSNIVPFLSSLPDRLTYKGSVTVNPLNPSNTSNYNDFAFYNTGIDVLADIDIPMRFNASDFTLKSNAAVDFSNLSQLDNVRSGNFVIQATNSYPFSARLQALMLDAQGQVIDSLFVPGGNVIAAATLDNQNLVTGAVSSRVLIPIDEQKVAKLRRTTSIQIISQFIMPPNPPDIRIYEHYKLDVNIIAELSYNVTRN